jgi:hypothetical protein
MPRPFFAPQPPLAFVLLAMTPLLHATPARAHTVQVDGNGRTDVLECHTGDAVVNGSGNNLVFHGPCRTLRVVGSGNTVKIRLIPDGGLAITGSGNHVTYSPIKPGPLLTTAGTGNVVGPGDTTMADTAMPGMSEGPPAPPSLAPPASAVGTLMLSGDNQDRRMSCTDRNVVIEGNHGSFVFSGGCRGITVEGHMDVVTAELMPGAHVAIWGDEVMLHYTLTRPGAPPVVTVEGNGSQVGLSNTGAAQ